MTQVQMAQNIQTYTRIYKIVQVYARLCCWISS